MNNNDILARWRDASTDPPPSGWCGLNTMANGSRYYGACGYMPGDQWLDITAIPGVPREAVQAAVDEMAERLGKEEVRCECHYVGCGDCMFADRDSGACKSLDILHHHTGVTPSEVL